MYTLAIGRDRFICYCCNTHISCRPRSSTAAMCCMKIWLRCSLECVRGTRKLRIHATDAYDSSYDGNNDDDSCTCARTVPKLDRAPCLVGCWVSRCFLIKVLRQSRFEMWKRDIDRHRNLPGQYPYQASFKQFKKMHAYRRRRVTGDAVHTKRNSLWLSPVFALSHRHRQLLRDA